MSAGRLIRGKRALGIVSVHILSVSFLDQLAHFFTAFFCRIRKKKMKLFVLVLF